MDNLPVNKKRNEIKKTYPGKTEVLDSSNNTSSFVSFRYSYKSVSSFGGKTYVSSKEQKFENGKFESKEFDGTLDGNAYNEVLRTSGEAFKRTQEQFIDHFSSFFKSLPFVSNFFPVEKDKK